MSPRSKKEYIEVTSLRYTKASRKKKSAILDEFCAPVNVTVNMPYGSCEVLNDLLNTK